MTLEELEQDLRARKVQAALRAAEREAISDGWEQVKKVLERHYFEPDVQAARVLYAAVAAHDLTGAPVWPMAVAPPSSMKTEIVRALEGLPHVHAIDSITPKTFISGQIKDPVDRRKDLPPSSLLHRLGNSAVIICADFSTILAIKADDRRSIMADLRRIYDGELKKEFGTSDTVPAWTGRITLLACVTPEIDKQYSAIQSLGDRFVMVRWKRAGQEAAIRAMLQDTTVAREELKTSVHALLKDSAGVRPTLTEPMLYRLAALAEFAVRARSHVSRASEGDKAIIGEPQAESAPRLAQQLSQLAKGSARLSNRTIADEEDFLIARRAAFDSIPARRRSMLELAMADKKVASGTSTQKYDREELQALGLLAEDRLSTDAKQLIEQINDTSSQEIPPTRGET
jgi:hypothetical protein